MYSYAAIPSLMFPAILSFSSHGPFKRIVYTTGIMKMVNLPRSNETCNLGKIEMLKIPSRFHVIYT